ncbi:maleylpyruvate isomerase family mycothiol-dependent enzyme [Gryllotalpicola ginsengisoli]|uniref:maleylpyruvate isomerase family mycothiol-dependent enzyme n=1 Tax=Gryllotalpicola ginsengisoli TaxID=444608 RepID=UPI0003B6FE2E|nr:maleylpyruvate isomerase family mycothiol-dependent enzyme [Gryllotalpicola ginsengisoli]
MTLTTRSALWAAIHAERTALADDVAGLDGDQWQARSLCSDWSVEQVVAHLTASATLGPARWFASVVGARFDFDLHNQRRMLEHLGSSPAETLARFRAVVTSTTAAPGPVTAWLGEIVVHSEDIRRPLGLTRAFPAEVTETVARFYATTNFAVPSRKVVSGFRVEASDGDFAAGDGPLVRGSTLALVMVMAGRSAYLAELDGPGVAGLEGRLHR